MESCWQSYKELGMIIQKEICQIELFLGWAMAPFTTTKKTVSQKQKMIL